MDRITVINTPCSVADYAMVQELVEEWTTLAYDSEMSALSVDFTNAHIVAMRSCNEEFYQMTQSVDHFVPDSQVLTWAVNLFGGKHGERVYGPDFLDYSIRNGSPELKHYFLGGNQECIDKLLVNLKKIQPELLVEGVHHGYFTEEEEEEIVQTIDATDADVVWIGLGTPKQQAFIDKWKEHIPGKAMLAVGFAFDVNAGTKKDAPTFMGPMGLIWIYRLINEPKRLFLRYLKYNSIFFFGVLKQLAKLIR